MNHGVDLFVHDSDHSYGHMLWEYSTAWPRLSGGGVLYSDDIEWNSAFRDFSQSVNHHGVKFTFGLGPASVGGIRKRL